MTVPSLSVQLDRLRKHWLTCRQGYNEVALLDLAHTLRVIAEAAGDVAGLIATRRIPGLPHASLGPEIKKVLGKSDFLAVLLPGGLKAGHIEASTVILIQRALSEAEVLRMKQLLRSHIAGQMLAPERWFGAEIVVARRTTPTGPERVGLSRTIVIKRVANTLGGSHIGDKDSDNQFDWAVQAMLSMRIADIPAPYCVVMKIAQDILVALDPAVSTMKL